MTSTNIKTEHYGDIQVWKEVQHKGLDIEVWAAAGVDVHGRGHRGYGGTTHAAVVSLLGNMEKGRLGTARRTEALGSAFRPLSDFARQGSMTGRFTSDRPNFEVVDKPVSQIEASLDYIQRTYGDRVDLPQQFWYLATHDQKIPAIKMLREITGLTLKSAKDVVDKIAASAPARQYESAFRADLQPIATVIRINGDMDDSLDSTPFSGYVFEKLGTSVWQTGGDEHAYDDSKVQEPARKQGYEILYLPKGA